MLPTGEATDLFDVLRSGSPANLGSTLERFGAGRLRELAGQLSGLGWLGVLGLFNETRSLLTSLSY